jgi:hypothetical protein
LDTEAVVQPINSHVGLRITRKSGIFPGRNGGQKDDVNRERPKSVTPMELEQRHITKFVHLKGLKLGDIAAELSNVYGNDVDPKSSITYWLYQLRLGRKYLTTQHVGGRPPLDDTDIEILSILRISPFSWVRAVADSLGIPASTVLWHFVEKIGFKNSLLRSVQHTLTDDFRRKRIELAGQSLELLESQRSVQFHDIVTGDEYCFLQHYDHERIWCVSADEVPTRVRPTMVAPETMLTVFLSDSSYSAI